MAGLEQRVDKWLFFARVVKSRSLAQKLALSGAVRVNREKVSHAARIVRPGDVLTISVHERIRILRVLEPGLRRGPAGEAALLFEDLTPQAEPIADDEDETAPLPPATVRPHGRPSKRERRQADGMMRGYGED